MPRRRLLDPSRAHQTVPTSWLAKDNAALAWLVCAICFTTAGAHWFSPTGDTGDMAYTLVLGGGAAIFAYAMRRRIYFALRVCRRVALVSGIVNALLLYTAATAFVVSLMVRPMVGAGAASPEEVTQLLLATAITAAPWFVWWSLREERVRSWFAADPTVV